MRRRGRRRLWAIAAVAGVLLAALPAYTAANLVPPTRAGQTSRPIPPNDLKPAACADLALTTLVTGSRTITGTAGNDLVLGSADNDAIIESSGDNCIVGGGGSDEISIKGPDRTRPNVCIISATSRESGCATVIRFP